MSNGLVHVTTVVGVRGAGQDRAGVQEVGDRVVIALADGAGGTRGGAKAAQAVVDAVFAAASQGPGLLPGLGRTLTFAALERCVSATDFFTVED
jgi:serine/threonine protein phosphatase PrpC